MDKQIVDRLFRLIRPTQKLILALGVFAFSSLATLPLIAATYYVDRHHPSASDTNPGTEAQPYLTVQKAVNMVQRGDTVIVKPGDYNENINTKSNTQLPGTAMITYKALGSPKDPATRSSLRQFFIKHSHITVDGFEFYRPRAMWSSAIHNKDVKDLQNINVVNNYIHDGVYALPQDVTLQPTSSGGIFRSASAKFLESGFEVGGSFNVSCPDVAVGADVGYSGNFVIDSLTNSEIISHRLTDTVQFPPTAGPTYCYIYINSYGISINAVDYQIRNNTLHNLVGNYINLIGRNGLVENNEASAVNGYDVFRIFGENYVIRNNYAHDSKHIRGNGNHPDLWQTWGFEDLSSLSRNVLIERNFFHNMDSQICMIQPNWNHNPAYYNPGIYGYTVKNNVFSKITNQANSGMPNIDWVDNTFVLNGGTGGDGGNIVGFADYRENSAINNIFVSPVPDRTNTGWYATGGPDFIGDYNFVSGSPPSFKKKANVCPGDGYNFCEPHGINGGDPLFKNIYDPVGPDGIPWTADDGLIPMATSSLCYSGKDGQTIGAYECQGCVGNDPIAYIASDKNEGFEKLTINFDASRSMACSQSGSPTYEWDFGDGSTGSGVQTSHQFDEGNYLVTLTVTNGAGRSTTVEKPIIVYPSSEPNLVLYLNFNGNAVDMSGRNNYVAWQQETAEVYSSGRFGEAGSFSNSRTGSSVGVRHKEGLDGTEVQSLSFWAKKETAGENEEVVLKHTVSKFFIGASNVNGYLFSETSSVNFSANVNNNNTDWHHYAMVYNGTDVKIYFDGQQVDSKPLTGKVRNAPDRSITIGRDPWGESFNGAIDELKIYERDLSPDDIQAIYTNTPQLDKTPPTRRNALPKTVPSGTTQTTISINTNEAATCKMSATANVSFDAIPTLFENTGGLTHSSNVTNLKEGQTFNYYARCQDVAGNTNESDFLISFYVLKQGEEPLPPLPPPGGESGFSTSVSFDRFKNIFNLKKDPPMRIRYFSDKGPLSVKIIDRSGNVVRDLEPGSSVGGTYETQWSGHNNSHEFVSAGTYTIILDSGGASMKRKVVVVK